MAYTLDFNLALGAGNAGLTLAAQLLDTTGANVGSAVTTGFFEVGGGNYLWHYAAFPDGHRGGVKFSTSPGGVLKAFAAINPQDAENLDIKVSTRQPIIAGAGANSVTITLQTSGAVPIPGQNVTVKNSAETAVIAGPVLTNASGQAVFALDNGTYHVLVSSTAAYAPLAAQTLVVAGTTTATYTLTPFTAGAPASPSLCRIFGFLKKLDGTAAVGAEVAFRLTDSSPFRAAGNTVVVTEVKTTTDGSGYFQADLTRSSQLTPVVSGASSQYWVQAPDADLLASFTVPDATSADLASLVLTP